MIRVVICDDEIAALKIITYCIEHQGFPIEIVGTAVNGTEAVRLIQEEKPDIAFLDIEMPKLNGFEVIEKLAVSNTKIVIVTAYNTFDFAQRALRLGASDILAKPIKVESLRQTIHRVIGWSFTENEILNKALFYIHTHFNEKIELRYLAETACCTPSHLSHLFRKQLDTSALAYLHKVRINEAVERLKRGDEIQDVAYGVGYDSMNNFYKYFKEYIGETPAVFKKKSR